MHILHLALGGCLTAYNVRYGITEDTGGHIAYVLGAAEAQAQRADVARVDIVTRAFDDASLGAVHARLVQPIGAKLCILRLATADSRYLAKEALAAHREALQTAFADLIERMAAPPDVVHAHFADAFEVARPVTARYGITSIYTPHSLGIDKRAALRNADDPIGHALQSRIDEERKAMIAAHGIVVSSRDEAERQIESYGADVAGKVRQIWPGLSLPASPAGTRLARDLVDPLLRRPDLPMVLAIARPVRKKNLPGLIKAYLAHPTLHERANLVVLAGQRGPDIAQNPEMRAVLAELKRLAAGRPGSIALPSRHRPESVTQLYRLAARRSGVFVNPAHHEPFGLTLLEAAQAGLPVVATRAGGPPDILGRIEHGVLVDPSDTDGIGAAISNLLEDREAWTEAAAAGQRNIAAFDWDRWAAQVQRFYSDLRATPRRFPSPRHIVACDIDGTLTGSRDGAAAFRRWDASRAVPFVVATGRCVSEARRVLAEWDLPSPDAFITAVGTELHQRDGNGSFALCPEYAARLDLGWDRDRVLQAVVRSALSLQPSIEQRRWKLACYGNLREAKRLCRALRDAGIAARIVPSHGRFIDVLAPSGGKAAALSAYARNLGLTLADCVAAGDSGNDLDMLSASGQAILVGNALPDLTAFVGGTRVYRARSHHAAGVLEGLARLGLHAPRNELAISA